VTAPLRRTDDGWQERRYRDLQPPKKLDGTRRLGPPPSEQSWNPAAGPLYCCRQADLASG